MTTFEQKQAEIEQAINQINDKILELAALEAKMKKKTTKEKAIDALSEGDMAEIEEMLQAVDTYMPLISKVIDKAMSFGPELNKIFEAFAISLTKTTVDCRVLAIKRYQDNGFTREEAITMMLDDLSAIRRTAQNFNTSKRK